MFGTYIGHNGTAYRNENTPEFVKSLMKKCNVLTTHEGKLLVRKRIIKGKEAWIITNPTGQKVTEQINSVEWKNATTLFEEPIEIKNNTIIVSLESLDVAIILFH